jgi:N6-adenosine-specific RNA methylase IME4/ParB-like chromosome segregation protein Spo0J
MSATKSNGSKAALGQLQRRPADGLKPHPQAAEVPALSEGAYLAVKADIAERGLQVALEITEPGTVLDGHARLRAARELGIREVAVIVVAPRDDLEHMLRAALQRRQLTSSQRAALAVKLAAVKEHQSRAAERQLANLRQRPDLATLPTRDETEGLRTRELVAKLAGTGERTAQDVLTVHEHNPALFERVTRGELSANTAASQVRRAIRDAGIPAAPPLPEGPYGLILADPPWSFGSPDSGFAPEQHYPTMATAEIKSMTVPAAEDCVLFLWAVNCLLLDALEVVRAWGFEYRNNLVWIKNGIGPGVWLRQRHELLLIATKGKVSPPDPQERVDSVIEAARTRHSEKPGHAYERIEAMYPQLSKLELFARNSRPGWTGWGNQADQQPTEEGQQA